MLAIGFACATLLSNPVPSVEAAPAAQQPRPPIDLFLLIDESYMMAGDRFHGRASQAVLRDGTALILNELEPQRDRAALVGFGDVARVHAGLGRDRDTLLAAFAGLDFADESARLDLAYHRVGAILATESRPEAVVVTIAITPGPAMQAPDLARARAKALEVDHAARHLAVAIGRRAQFALLRGIVVEGGLRSLDFGGDLLGVHEELAAMVRSLAGSEGMPTARPAAPTATITPPPPTSTPDPFASATPTWAPLPVDRLRCVLPFLVR